MSERSPFPDSLLNENGLNRQAIFDVVDLPAEIRSQLKTESGQQLMAQWGWSIARTDAYVTLGKELLDQAYYTRAIQTLQIAIDREPENVDALAQPAGF